MGYGGEGGIRTPDSLSTMPDFESGAFNRALPPLREGMIQEATCEQPGARSVERETGIEPATFSLGS